MHPNREQQFWDNVHKTDTCWLWKKARTKDDYGLMSFAGKQYKAHRLSWLLAHGAIPAGLHVLHRCDTPNCVRPEHLFLGTHRDNMADRAIKGRANLPRGEAHGSSRLTAAQVLAIRERRKNAGASFYELGRAFSISAQHALNICHGRVWKHLPL